MLYICRIPNDAYRHWKKSCISAVMSFRLLITDHAVARAEAEGRITNRGIDQPLKSHIAKVEKGGVDDPDTYRALEQFIQAQSGKHIDEQTASELLRLIARLQDA